MAHLYFVLMTRALNSHRIFIAWLLLESSLQNNGGSKPCWTSHSWLWVSVCSLCRLATPTLATGSEERSMIFDYALAGLVTAGLLFYLTYALLRPEKF